MMKNAFYFMLKGLFILEIFNFFDFLVKRLGNKDIVTFKIYDVTDWTTNNYNAHITQSGN